MSRFVNLTSLAALAVVTFERGVAAIGACLERLSNNLNKTCYDYSILVQLVKHVNYELKSHLILIN